MQKQTGQRTQRDDEVERNHHTLLLTCHPAGPTAKNWPQPLSVLNFSSRSSTQKRRLALTSGWTVKYQKTARHWTKDRPKIDHTSSNTVHANACVHVHTSAWYKCIQSGPLVPMRRKTRLILLLAESQLNWCFHHGGALGDFMWANHSVKAGRWHRLPKNGLAWLISHSTDSFGLLGAALVFAPFSLF